MARTTSNAALAYDMDAPAYGYGSAAGAALREAQRPRFDVYTGEGRQTDQVVSPEFTRVIKVFAALVVLFFAVGVARVAIAGVTTAELNAGAAAVNELSAARDASGDLEVMRSVYGSDTRIRDIAVNTYGMTEPTSSVTLDLSDAASQGAAGADAA